MDKRTIHPWMIFLFVVFAGMVLAFLCVFISLFADAASDTDYYVQRPALVAATYLVLGLLLGSFTNEKPWLLAACLTVPAILLLAFFAASHLDLILLIHLFATAGSAFIGVILGRYIRTKRKSNRNSIKQG